MPEVVESLDVPPMPPVPLEPPLEPVLPVAPDEDPLEDGDRFVVNPPVPVLPELPLLGESLETLGIDPVPFGPLLIVSEPVVLPEPLPIVPLIPLVPPVPPVPFGPPIPLLPPDDCAYANPTPAANIAAARPAPILVAFILISSKIVSNPRECEDEGRWSPKSTRGCRGKMPIQQ